MPNRLKNRDAIAGSVNYVCGVSHRVIPISSEVWKCWTNLPRWIAHGKWVSFICVYWILLQHLKVITSTQHTREKINLCV